MALVTLLKHSHRVPALLSPASLRSPPHLTSGPGEGASAPGRGAFAQERCQASWGHRALSSDLGPGVTRKYASFCASVRAREQFCYCINLTQLTHLRN